GEGDQVRSPALAAPVQPAGAARLLGWRRSHLRVLRRRLAVPSVMARALRPRARPTPGRSSGGEATLSAQMQRSSGSAPTEAPRYGPGATAWGLSACDGRRPAYRSPAAGPSPAIPASS